MVHIHGIWNVYVPVKLLSKMWLEITGDSYIVEVARIQSQNDAVKYLFKYLTKNVQPENIDKYDNDFFGLDLINTAKLFYENDNNMHFDL